MKRLVALVLALMMLSCVALGEGEGLHYLTKEDITQIYNPDALASYQDDTMAEPVVSGTAEELALTDEEIEQIRAMDLTICLQQDHLDDAMKLIQQAFQDACDELGITLGSIWMAADQSGAAARSDYENFLSVTDEYDAFFTCLSDASLNTDILKEIMEEIHTADVCQLQQFADLLPPRFSSGVRFLLVMICVPPLCCSCFTSSTSASTPPSLRPWKRRTSSSATTARSTTPPSCSSRTPSTTGSPWC